MRLFEWYKLEEGKTLQCLQNWIEEFLPQFELKSVQYLMPSFYDDMILGWLIVRAHNDEPASIYVLITESREVIPLDFSSTPILNINMRHDLSLNPKNAVEYLLFYCSFGLYPPMQFNIVRTIKDIPFDETKMKGTDLSSSHEYKKEVEKKLMPVKTKRTDDGMALSVECNMLHKGGLYHTSMQIDKSGFVEMLDDEILVDHLPYKLPSQHILYGDTLHGLLEAESSKKSSSQKESRKTQSEGNVDAHVMEVINRVLLTEALAKLDDTILFTSEISAKIDDHSLFDSFVEMLMETKPVIIIESIFPFFEEIVAKTITRREDCPLRFIRPSLNQNYNGEINSIGQFDHNHLLTLPIHSFRIETIAELVSHEISMVDSAVFIGCHTIRDVPEALQRITDLVIPIPSINEFNFSKIFEELFNKPVPSSQRADLKQWVNQVLPTDFQQPFRLKLDINRIIPFIKQRVRNRISEVSSESGPGLDDLYGLGEAKHIAVDLIADITAAKKKEISWDKVDKGLLIVGPPGTGKTTLARAIAKESGLKFINANAAEWQMADHLGYHLMNIRKDFALARRYAPSIIFIDELDSIGNRGDFSGKNAAYHTQIVNALLSEIQGFNDEDQVIVIGATNYLERIDPALRRAGRLDQIAHVSYPNIKALTKIYAYYLDPLSIESKPGKDQLCKELAQLSFGCTGADVEEYVRGASRRARKNDRKLQRQDLIDEITGKSRSATGTLRMNKEDMRRVAVHEAGHALARILSDTHGADISYVSIVPRSNGSLGFVASIPDEKAMYTRMDYQNLLEVILAGRAAEEILFGNDLISGGAGGNSSSDLAKATTIARNMITRHGLGNTDQLYWTDKVPDQDIDQIKELLHTMYQQVLKKLTAEKTKLEAIASILMEEQEIAGKELIERLK